LWFWKPAPFGWSMKSSSSSLFGSATVGVAGDLEASHHRVGVQIGVVDGEQPAARVVGRKGEPEHAPFAERPDARLDVEEGRRQRDSVLHDADAPGALDHEEPRVAVRRGHEQRLREAARHQQRRRLTLRGSRPGDASGEQQREEHRPRTVVPTHGGTLPPFSHVEEWPIRRNNVVSVLTNRLR
jgi:hypothetical protein